MREKLRNKGGARDSYAIYFYEAMLAISLASIKMMAIP